MCAKFIYFIKCRNYYFLYTGMVFLALCGVSSKLAHATEGRPSDQILELINIVRKQSAQIKTLERRIEHLEARNLSPNEVQRASHVSTPRNFIFKQEPIRGHIIFEPVRISMHMAAKGSEYDSFPLQPAPPGTLGAVSSMPSNSGPVSGVASEIPNRTTTIGGLVLKWGKGLPEITTPDGNYSFRVRGRILADYGATFGSRFRTLNVSRTMMRAARLGVEGRARNLSWVFESDFSSNTLAVMSAFATWTDKTFAHMAEYTLGNKFSERGFDGSTGSSDTVFLDRDLVANTLAPVMGWYGLGGVYKIYGNNWHISTQIAGDQVNGINVSSNVRDDMTYMFRAHYIPYRTNKSLLHLGVWGFYEDVKPSGNYSQDVDVLSRIDSAFSLQFGPTAPLSHSLAGGLEVFGIWRSMWALVEFGARHMDLRRTSGFPDSYAQYAGQKGTEKAFSAQYGWFITGETPNYFSHSGVWAAPRVLHPVTRGGLGGWEAAIRWDWADSSRIMSGSSAWTISLGINWYILNYVRVMFNFTRAHVYNTSGDYLGAYSGNTLGTRISVTF